MFRTRAVAVSLVFSLLLVALSWGVVRHLERGAREISLDRLHDRQAAIQLAARQRAIDQAFVAAAAADSPLAVALDVLDGFRPELFAAHRKAVESTRGLPEREAVEARRRYLEAYPAEGGGTLIPVVIDRMADLVQARWGDTRFGPDGRMGYVSTERARLAECLSVDARQCLRVYSFVTLLPVIESASESWKLPPAQHRFVVTDSRGVGLADSEHPEWTDDADFARTSDLARAARTTRLPQRDLMSLGGTWLLATAVPVLSEGEVVGTVVVADPVTRWMAETDSEAAGASIIYAIQGEFIEGSAPPEIAKKLVAKPGSVPGWAAVSFPMPGIPPERGFQVLAATDLSAVLSPYVRARLMLLVLGLLLAGLGAVLAFWLVLHHDRELESLYQGVHEVISGNQQYAFPASQKDETLRNLGNALNLMGQVFQGHLLQEDDEAAGPDAWTGETSWDAIDFAGETAGQPRATAREPGEDLVGIDVAALAALPAQAYHQRLFTEFVAARQAAGIPDEGITRESFLVRVIGLEQKMKKRYGVSAVRFVVATRGSEVILVPVKIRG